MHFLGLFVMNNLLLLFQCLSEIIIALCLFMFNLPPFLAFFSHSIHHELYLLLYRKNSSSLLSLILYLPSKKSEPYLTY